MRLMKAVFDFVIILERMRQDYLFMRMEIFDYKLNFFKPYSISMFRRLRLLLL